MIFSRSSIAGCIIAYVGGPLKVGGLGFFFKLGDRSENKCWTKNVYFVAFTRADQQCRTNRAAPWTSTVYDTVWVTVPRSWLLHTSEHLQAALLRSLPGTTFPMSDICADIVVLCGFRLKNARYISPITMQWSICKVIDRLQKKDDGGWLYCLSRGCFWVDQARKTVDRPVTSSSSGNPRADSTRGCIRCMITSPRLSTISGIQQDLWMLPAQFMNLTFDPSDYGTLSRITVNKRSITVQLPHLLKSCLECYRLELWKSWLIFRICLSYFPLPRRHGSITWLASTLQRENVPLLNSRAVSLCFGDASKQMSMLLEADSCSLPRLGIISSSLRGQEFHVSEFGVNWI